ncbi:Uncharacterised protein [Buttiauxella agrestis]|uniref:Uncharacterized protein n=1 Tax=Buttiauxella agrestis TaxID=82977 RepID=A0A381CEL8_9ENTR|nr:hypothetical protein [Buttiauxella agrestis]SUW65503.1 Uncharacterised protein [Buttiauxella agrestis]
MHEKLLELHEKLENLHTAVNAIAFPNENLIELGQYTFPFLSAEDLKYLPRMLAKKIEKIKKYTPTAADISSIDAIIEAISEGQPNLQYLNHSQANVSCTAIQSYLVSMLFISNEINELFSFEVLANRELLPKRILNRLELYNSNLNSISEKTGNIEEKINTINEAYDAAEGLPTTLKSLRETNEEISVLKESSIESESIIQKNLTSSSAAIDDIHQTKNEVKQLNENIIKEAEKYLNALKIEAQSYIDKCEEAFRTTTSKGLAGAFEDKAKKLNKSIQFWVAGLVGALISGALVGYTRLHALEAYLADPNSTGLKLLIQLILSILSVGGPLWFAWLATKQIGQRFRLAEDYEFKASVSKAYEGYRREALQLDEDFSQRLFGNALTRLEEPPLRFVEDTAHSSPLMEILSSDNFKKLIEQGGDKIDLVLEKAGLQKKNSEKKDNPIDTKEFKNEDEEK